MAEPSHRIGRRAATAEGDIELGTRGSWMGLARLLPPRSLPLSSVVFDVVVAVVVVCRCRLSLLWLVYVRLKAERAAESDEFGWRSLDHLALLSDHPFEDLTYYLLT